MFISSDLGNLPKYPCGYNEDRQQLQQCSKNNLKLYFSTETIPRRPQNLFMVGGTFAHENPSLVLFLLGPNAANAQVSSSLLIPPE